MSSTQAAPRWRFLISPRWLGWHLLMIVAVGVMLVLGDWQLHRAESGNALSWAYTFEWPIFAGFALVFWLKTIRDEFHPPGSAGPAEEIDLPPGARATAAADGGPGPGDAGHHPGEDNDAEDGELAAYNAYLSRLTREVKGHGRWHGIR